MKPKILLINPPWIKREGNIWKDIDNCMPPIGLGIMANCLEKKGFIVKILDAQAEKMTYHKIREFLLANKEFTHYGITATTVIYENALKTARICKEVNPDSIIVLGGVHPSVAPAEVLGDKNIDFVVRGEGEVTFVEFISGKSVSEIDGLSYKKDGRIIHNRERTLIENLDNLPFPAYHLLPMDKYYPALGGCKRLPAISILTSRGCPGKCTFCYKDMFGSHTRWRTARNIVDEINFLVKEYGIKEIIFYDDTFTTSKKSVREFCQLIIQERIDITWTCMSRIDWMDEELLRYMKKAGCHQICYGAESGDEQILKNIHKNIPFKKIKEICEATKKVGITCRLTFMLGNPGETEETMKKTLKFAVSLEPDIALFNITTPYPGTKMFEWAKEKGYIKTMDWDKYDLSTCVMELPTVSSGTVESYYKKSHKYFYLRPKYILRKLVKIRSLNDIKASIRALKAIIGK